VRRTSAIAALRHAGCVIETIFTDDQGAPLPEKQDLALRDEVENAIRELADGRAAHARRTIAALSASRKSDAEQVEDLLKVAYEAQARGVRSRDVLETLLDTYERWLIPDGIARVDFPSAVIALSLDPLIDEASQIFARRVARRYANQSSPILYGFGEPAAAFESGTGELTQPDAAFTCATFVLALLRAVGLLIIDCERWREPTEDDLQWQRKIGEDLLTWIETHIHGDLPRAKERVEHDLGKRRFRPTDVAGAALFGPDQWPVGAEDVDPRANELETVLSRASSSA